MALFSEIKNALGYGNILSSGRAYKLWAEHYDDPGNNLMLHYDEIILDELLKDISLKDKTILDYGCGTGRNLPKYERLNAGNIICCDSSIQMLKKLKEKHPDINTHRLKNNKLNFLKDDTIDLIICTLVVAHIKKIEPLFREWNRTLKENAQIIITDFHPALLLNGGERTFNSSGNTYKIRNFIHKINDIESELGKYGFKLIRKIEYTINNQVKEFYEEAGALNVFNKFYDQPFIYGISMVRK